MSDNDAVLASAMRKLLTNDLGAWFKADEDSFQFDGFAYNLTPEEVALCVKIRDEAANRE